MAIIPSLLRFLLTQRDAFRTGVEGGKLLSLGVQDVHSTHSQIEQLAQQAGIEATRIPENERRYTTSQIVTRDRNFAQVNDLFSMLGYDEVETLDFSDAGGRSYRRS